jgi:uncharacterized repeat protein (TIGR01451 family)/fimbrial isopeptide formation D2 family protein
VVIGSQTGGSVTVYANGGDGGNAWRSHTTLIDRHGPGGGGSGGFVAYSPATGFAVSATVNGGTSGRSCNNDAYGSTSSSGGIYTFQTPNAAGPLPGASCVPNLATSTKTVVDLNGGDYSAGDVLQYTITLRESNGAAAATGVSVTDPIDSNLTNFTVVSFPAGATDSSTSSALNISGITVPANGSVSIVFNATISASAAPGTTIPNTATVINPLGNGATPVAPVVTVTGSIAATGNKRLYLYGTPSLSRTVNSSTTAIAIGTSTTRTFPMSPVAAGPITINGAIPVQLIVRRATTSGTRSVTATLQCGTTGTIFTGTQNCTANTGYNLCTINLLPLATNETCPTGSTWNLSVRNNDAADGIRIYPYNAGISNYSYAALPAKTVINVDSIGLYNSGGSAITQVTTGSTVYIRAVVSDPFGSYDIVNAPTITIRDPGNNTLVNAAAMTLDATGAETPSLTKTFQYAYLVPASPTGNWSISVSATEGTEGMVSHSAFATMPVVIPQPSLTVVKSASPSPAVNPGQVVTYTVLVTNTGPGVATNVVITDSLSPYVSWGLAGFTFSASSSGLTLGTPAYSSNNGGTWVYTPTSGGGGAPAGYDANVTNWRIPMSGTMNANGANFTINYQVQVK